MDYKEVIREILIENRKIIEAQELVDRDYTFERDANYVLTGIRRSGKTSIMQLQAKRLVEEGASWNQIAYINFEDERLYGFKLEDFNSILEVQRTFTNKTSYYFFDEIQIIEGWERFARRVADSKEHVWISGSNADMLGREITSRLGGRYMITTVHPFSFKEFLISKGKENLLATDLDTKHRNERLTFLNEYLHTGGFPESINHVDRRAYTQAVFSKIYQGDIALRHGVRNDEALRVMFRKIAESTCNELSYSRLFNTLKTIGLSIGKSSLINYVKYAEESFVLFGIENYVYKLADKESKRKYYYMDNGLLNLFLTSKDSALLENLIAIELHRRYDLLLHFVRGKNEVDFYVPDSDEAVQVAYSVKDKETLDREVKGLLSIHKTWGLRKAVIVTYDEKDEINIDGLKIEIIPADEFCIM